MRDKLNQQFAYLKDMFENNNYAILPEVDKVEDEIKLRILGNLIFQNLYIIE